jgi:hypothetical protein
MMKASRFIFVPLALGIIGTASIAIAQEPVPTASLSVGLG